MNLRKNIVICFCFVFLTFLQIKAQNFDISRGLPFIRNYLPEEYHAHEKNFGIIQSHKGFMYFANFAGVLQFDGSKWEKIMSSRGMRIVSLSINDKGRIFAGGLYDFGYLETSGNGVTKFISLAGDEDTKNIGLISKVICFEKKVYFFSAREMYVLEKDKVIKVPFEGQLLSAFQVNDEIYIFFNPENEKMKLNGLYRYKQAKFEKISINSTNPIMDISFMISSFNENEILIGTANQGLFTLKNNQIEEWITPSNNYLKNNRLNCCVWASQSMYAFGTSTGGVLLVRKNGQIVQVIDQASGLNDDAINDVFIDKASSLWLATDNGISKAEVNWPLTYINNKTSGLEGKVQDIEFLFGRLFFATDKGLFYLENNRIDHISKINSPSLALLKTSKILFAATSRGIFSIDLKNSASQISDLFTFSLTISFFDKNRIYSGHRNSVKVWSLSENSLKPEFTIDKILGDVIKIIEDENGDLFFEVSPGKIYLYQPRNKKLTEISKETDLLTLHLNKKGKQIFISSEKGLFQVDKNSFKLVKHYLAGKDTSSQSLWMHQLYEISENNLIFTNGEQKNLCFFNADENKIILNQTPFLPIADFSVQSIWFDQERYQLWAGGKDGMIISNQKVLYDYSVNYATELRRITLINKDSLLSLKSDTEHHIRYSDNSILFEYAVPVYPVIGQVKYRYFLKGFDKDTSEWVTENKKEYTNLPDKQYLFTVEAQNEFGKIAAKTNIKFKILTPLYRQWWAILIYFTIIILAGRYFIVWRMRASKKEKEQLESLVKERTEEIEQSKQKIEEQRDIAYKQKKEILDSISYAQRIQQAVLPSTQFVEDILLEHFILYRPRDIVSGDFYWMKKINNYVAVVAADCTGHGVPGAFMSMLGSSFLNEIVTRRSLDNASQILNRLRNRVKRSLHQEGKEGEQKDGMDIALIIIDSESLVLQYSGAYNPLYIIRANKDVDSKDESIDLEVRFELIHLKADRQPIGIHLNEKEFTNHVFQLQGGDCLYSFSDGYVDQFGGETGEKFKQKRFKDLLLSVQGKSMFEQKQILEQAFVKWKRDLAQIDDVLVMGIKI